MTRKKTSDQPIGVWDYDDVKCNIHNSIRQYAKSAYLVLKPISIEEKENRYILYNSHFKESQTSFNLGCDFFLYTPAFLDRDSDTSLTLRRADILRMENVT